MTEWVSGDVIANGLNIHYYRTGGDKPPVVLSHGITDDGLCWTEVAKALEEDYDVIMLDTRGHGLSGNPEGDYSVEARVADVAGVIESLGLDRPVIMGHSFGAQTSLHTAANHPDLIRGAILEDPLLLLPGETVFGGDTDKGKNFAKGLVRMIRLYKMMPVFVTRWLAKRSMPDYPDDVVIPWMWSKRRVSEDLIQYLEIPREPTFDMEVVREIKIPTLLITGEREKGAIVSQAGAEKARELSSSLRVAHIPGAGHGIRRDQLAAYMDAVREFLEEVTA